MSNALVGLLLAVGGGTWIYSKAMRYTGNNTQQSVIVAAFGAIVIFIVAFTLLGAIFND